MNRPLDLSALTRRFHAPGTALVLTGSHTREDAGLYSDVDLVRFTPGTEAPPGDGSHLVEGRLVVVSSATPQTVEGWFTRPEEAVTVVAGLRTGRTLADPDGLFEPVRARALAFAWDEGMRTRADDWAAGQMVGWAEEANKGLEGLRRGGLSRLLLARHGLSWGMARVVLVHRGLLLESENALVERLTEVVGPPWSDLLRRAFGAAEPGEALSLAAQVEAGLRLYVATAEMLGGAPTGEREELVSVVVEGIRRALQADLSPVRSHLLNTP